MLEKLVTLITDLIAALNRNSDLLEGGTKSAKTSTDKPDAAATKTTTKTAEKTTTKTPEKTTKKEVKPPIKNKDVSVEDAVATATSFMAIDDPKEREARKAWVIELVKSLGYDKVRNIDSADDRSTLVLKIEQTIEAGELLPIETDESLEEAEDEV